MKNSIRLSDFTFGMIGYGQYEVGYVSPITGESWYKRITDMELIDSTKNAYEPTKKDLETLKRTVKRGNY